jgi:putative Mg2+ transporter-C (MgtC) family protein
MDISLDTQLILIGKILLSALLGAIIGIERDLSGRPAGLRTNMIISMAACLFTIVSIEGFRQFGDGTDLSRVAAQIVSGVGFLGAGALIHNQDRVLGLTTAADIWLVAAIGMAVGSDLYAIAIFTGIFSVLALTSLNPLSHYFERVGNQRMKKKGVTVVKEK